SEWSGWQWQPTTFHILVYLSQHAPAEEGRIRRRREVGRPALELLQRIGIHHDAAPAALDDLKRRPHSRRVVPQQQAVIRHAADIEAGVSLDPFHAGIGKTL